MRLGFLVQNLGSNLVDRDKSCALLNNFEEIFGDVGVFNHHVHHLATTNLTQGETVLVHIFDFKEGK